MRTLSLKVLTQNELVKIETNASTFGEFKKEPSVTALGIDWSSAKLIDRGTKNSIEVDEAVLPATDSILFVMPTKSKAGMALGYKEVKAKIKEFKERGGVVPFNYTQASTEQLNKFWDTVKGGETLSQEPANESEDPENVFYLKPGTYTLVVEGNETEVEEVHLVDTTTLEDLEDEAKQLKKLFK